jgi:hypothetical protein
LTNWVNPAAYQPDPVATLSTGAPSDVTLYGNTPRNCIIGPQQKNVDFSLGKKFSDRRPKSAFPGGFLQPVQPSVFREPGRTRGWFDPWFWFCPDHLNNWNAAADPVFAEVFFLTKYAGRECLANA